MLLLVHSHKTGRGWLVQTVQSIAVNRWNKLLLITIYFMQTHTVSPYIMYTILIKITWRQYFSLLRCLNRFSRRTTNLHLFLSLLHTHFHRPLLTILLSTITYHLFERTQFFAVQLFTPCQSYFTPNRFLVEFYSLGNWVCQKGWFPCV